MALKSLLGNTLPIAVGASLGALSTKVNEGADRLLTTGGGWGAFTKLTATGQNRDVSAASYVAGERALEAQGLSSQQARQELIQSGDGKVTNLDPLQAELEQLRTKEQEVTAAQLKEIIAGDGESDLVGHKVKLVEKGVDQVIFDIMPEVVESRTVEYEPVAPPQHPSAFQKYKGTSSTQWTINATLTCRNIDEATANLRILNVLRGWTVPFFGDKVRASYPDKLGAPPPVLEFSGWRNQMVGPVQVVITSLNWNFPQDVDYIAARGFQSSADPKNRGRLTYSGELVPFPTVIKLAIQLVESFSTDQINGFDLAQFRAGRFDKAFAQTLSAAVETGRSARGLQIGGAVVDEEAQTVPGNQLSVGSRPASSPTSIFGAGPVTEALELIPSFGSISTALPPLVELTTNFDSDIPAAPPVAPPAPVIDVTLPLRQQLNQQLTVLGSEINRLQALHDATVAQAIDAARAGVDATELEAAAASMRQQLLELRSSAATIQQQYDQLITGG